jgi:hypothetical protein
VKNQRSPDPSDLLRSERVQCLLRSVVLAESRWNPVPEGVRAVQFLADTCNLFYRSHHRQ